jgi:hypothetical protein
LIGHPNDATQAGDAQARLRAAGLPSIPKARIIVRLYFQAQQPLPGLAAQGELLVATADHKGVPMVRRDRPQAGHDEDREHPGTFEDVTIQAGVGVGECSAESQKPRTIATRGGDVLFRNLGNALERRFEKHPSTRPDPGYPACA